MTETYTAAEWNAKSKKLSASAKAKAIAEKMQKLNALFQFKLTLNEIEFVTEYKFEASRKWKTDYYFPTACLALEIEGGAFTGGRHTSGTGFIKDIEKYNALTMKGIKLLRCTPNQLLHTNTINNILTLCKQN
jgi:very-short-patch-repair endonuclease